ncbi:unnamed protein product [Trifolium pratense]|uniref:Uncharacterized protein n=1 Tax=Trifolium pratense TaxID=57577 RepID=A0ACB0M9A6_TRIPR|nr:unnamed protein product [Trifolium pratense]
MFFLEEVFQYFNILPLQVLTSGSRTASQISLHEFKWLFKSILINFFWKQEKEKKSTVHRGGVGEDTDFLGNEMRKEREWG